MAQGSSIEWSEATSNPVTGCTKISPGCKHCYAERVAERLQAMGQPNYENGFDELGPEIEWTSNIWMGVSVESSRYVGRIDDLRRTHAHVRFLSLEPHLGPLSGLDLRGIHWAIVGGESGPRARPMDAAWAIDLRDQCKRARVPFFVKQWGGKNKKRAGRVLEGRTWDEMPKMSAPSVEAKLRRSGRSLPVAL